MNYSIRPINFTDIDAVHAIETRVHITPWSWSIIRDCVLVGYDCRLIEIPDNAVNRIIGYLIARHAENSYHILNLCIDKEFQGQGFGRKLLETALNAFPSPTIKDVILEVRPSNVAAIALYESLGFIELTRKVNYYQDATGMEDAILLQKIL